MYKIRRILMLLLATCFLLSCENQGCRRSYLTTYFEDHLKPGDSQSQVEDFLVSEKWTFRYLDMVKRYSISDPETKGNRYAWNVIYIYLDENNRFKRVEVVTAYNGI